MNASALVFDLDGTLLDTLESLARSFNDALTSLDCPTHPVEDFRYIIGDGLKVAVERSLPADRLDLGNECIDRFRDNYNEYWRDARPFNGIPEVLASLDQKIPLAVLSNKNHEYTSEMIDHFFPNQFDVVLGFSKDIKHKPHPSGAEQIAKELGLALDENIWMIGDTATDMNTARATGMTGVGVLWGFRDQEELESGGASHLITQPKELLNLL